MEEMVFLTIVTRSIGSARQMRPPSNPPKRVEATLRQTAERGTTLEVKHPSTWRGRGRLSVCGISLHDPNYFRIILPPIYYASGTADRVSPIPTFLRNLSLSLCLILESVGKKHLSVCFVCLKSSEGLIVYSSHFFSHDLF